MQLYGNQREGIEHTGRCHWSVKMDVNGGVAKYRTRRMEATYGGFNRENLELLFHSLPQ
jgi:hypothetical protein